MAIYEKENNIISNFRALIKEVALCVGRIFYIFKEVRR
jgi:hypothetical protein